MENKKVFKILIPILMICAIVSIGIIKKNPQKVKEDNIITSDNEYPLNVVNVNLEELSKIGLPMIIDFGANECIPCKEMAPALVEINEEMQGKAIIKFVDVWKYPEASKGFPVQLIPTQIIVEADGTPYVPSEEIAKTIRFRMYTDGESEEHAFTTHQGGLTKEQMRIILADMGVEI